MTNRNGHLAALVTILIWSTTFISTKILLVDMKPLEILVVRFVIGLLCLYIVYPKRLKLRSKKEEIYFALAGLSGISFYYLLENIALTYTSAANVGILIATAPFFTAMLSLIFYKEQTKLTLNFFLGFLLAIVGIACISLYNQDITLHPFGDLLALLAALLWALYSIILKKISSFQYHTIATTRRIFLYGIVFMIPATFIFPFSCSFDYIFHSQNLIHILFLGIGASALCFVTWNYASKVLGPLKTSVYIYLVPLITTLASALFLKEHITFTTILGMVCILLGLFLSEKRQTNKKELAQ